MSAAPSEAAPVETKFLGTKDDWKTGERACFEYRCFESEQSADADLWRRTHQIVTVVGVDPDGEEAVADTLRERIVEAGMPLNYIVRFTDGHEASVFEDELLISPEFFTRLSTPQAF